MLIVMAAGASPAGAACLLALTALWCLVNTGAILQSPPDPYPYQLFNLALAILVGLQGPLIVMSQNRQARKDRARSDTDFKVNLKNEVNIETVLRELAWMDEITGSCFSCFDRFPIMATATMLYFTAAVYCEERERNGHAGEDEAKWPALLPCNTNCRWVASRLVRPHAPYPRHQTAAAPSASAIAFNYL